MLADTSVYERDRDNIRATRNETGSATKRTEEALT